MNKVVIGLKGNYLFEYVDVDSSLKYHLLDSYITPLIYFPLRWKRQLFDKYEQICSA